MLDPGLGIDLPLAQGCPPLGTTAAEDSHTAGERRGTGGRGGDKVREDVRQSREEDYSQEVER